MAPNPAELIAQKLQAASQPGETVENGPGGSLYLSDKRFFVAKYNPMKQEATVAAFDLADITDIRLESGQEMGDKPASRFVEVGLKDRPPTGLTGSGGAAEIAFIEKPNVIYCGRGAEAEMVGEAIAQVLRTRHQKATAPPPEPEPAPPPPPPPTNIPADWYPDPKGEKRLRYWDGTQWTDHVAD